MNTDIKTWATLKPDTPFNQFFPDRRVPITSPIGLRPRDETAPPCYEVDGSKLTDEQVDGLAEMLWQQWQPECTSKDQAVAYIRSGLPLNCAWFVGVTSVDEKLMTSLLYDADEVEEGDRNA